MISIIAAIGKNRELGKNNKLLWHIPDDMKRFKKLTTGNVVIMGRKTYDSLPEKFKPLPQRVNIVITRHLELAGQYQNSNDPLFCSSIEEAVEKAKEFKKEIFIIGGASIYQQGIKYAEKLYLTLVDHKYPDADAFFPEYSNFNKLIFEENHSFNDLQFKFIELSR